MGKSIRRLRLGLQTLLSSKKAGYFIPYRYASETPNFSEHQVAYPAIERLFQSCNAYIAAHLVAMETFAEDLAAIQVSAEPPAPRWGQDWFPGLDAAAGYSMLRRFHPKRLIEIGSGHSTRFYARAVQDGGLATQITAIDPAPRADLTALDRIELQRCIVQKADPKIFDTLQAGDFLCIDSSHILMPATDVDILLNTVIPRLPKDVFIHIHDMCLPWDYPPQWHWRGYNEQSGVAALINTGGFDVIWSSAWVNKTYALAEKASNMAALHREPGSLETSLWLRKNL